MSLGIRREIPILVTSLVAIFLTLEYFVDIPFLNNIGSIIVSWGVVISAFAMGLGMVTLFLRHGRHVMKQTKNQWFYSLILLVSVIITLITGFIPPIGTHWILSWIYQITVVPLGTAIYAMTGFYICSAAYRGFRIRNIPSLILIFTAFIVMLGNIPVGELIWSGFPGLKAWILSIPNGGANRGILIGMFIGIASLALRIFLGRESGYLGGEG
jgi:hypothetical protein